ncbi:hypothetical protein [Microlunatus ginsengisoli]|uniref:Uncharacterized protein n=1 Tax=Microlunatus ginsengisoli TaxID=363863 RepID=A0ABP6ZDZ8_9ACTN
MQIAESGDQQDGDGLGRHSPAGGVGEIDPSPGLVKQLDDGESGVGDSVTNSGDKFGPGGAGDNPVPDPVGQQPEEMVGPAGTQPHVGVNVGEGQSQLSGQPDHNAAAGRSSGSGPCPNAAAMTWSRFWP